MSIRSALRKLFSFEKEWTPSNDEEGRVSQLGSKAYLDGWHQNPYPAGSALHRAWQEGHDNTEYHHFRAW